MNDKEKIAAVVNNGTDEQLEYYEIPIGNGESRMYPIIGYVRKKGSDELCPLLDIPWLSDEKWQAQAVESAVNHYIDRHGVAPNTVEDAVKDERLFIKSILGEVVHK